VLVATGLAFSGVLLAPVDRYGTEGMNRQLIAQIGLVPITDFLKESAGLNRFGEIEADILGRRRTPGVFAAEGASPLFRSSKLSSRQGNGLMRPWVRLTT